VTVSENVENKNYGSSIEPSEIVPEPKPTSLGADGTQVTGADS
jgi:low density lipoprotein-related protein 2